MVERAHYGYSKTISPNIIPTSFLCLRDDAADVTYCSRPFFLPFPSRARFHQFFHNKYIALYVSDVAGLLRYRSDGWYWFMLVICRVFRWLMLTTWCQKVVFGKIFSKLSVQFAIYKIFLLRVGVYAKLHHCTWEICYGLTQGEIIMKLLLSDKDPNGDGKQDCSVIKYGVIIGDLVGKNPVFGEVSVGKKLPG